MADYQKPLPEATPETLPYWEAARQHRLQLPHCLDCERYHFYPRAVCPDCLSSRLEWRPVSGRGRLYSFVIPARAAPPAFQAEPYVIAVVELEEGPRLMSNIVDVPITIPPDERALFVDMPLEVVFDDVTPEVTLPKFRPAGGGV